MGHGRGKSASRSFPEIDDVLAGMILLWSGAEVDIPLGYVICDGTHGTPDLSGRFVRHPIGGSPVGSTGGAITHTHDYTSDSHGHTNSPGPAPLQTGAGFFGVNTAIVTGTTDSEIGLPPFYVLAYIMKT